MERKFEEKQPAYIDVIYQTIDKLRSMYLSKPREYWQRDTVQGLNYSAEICRSSNNALDALETLHEMYLLALETAKERNEISALHYAEGILCGYTTLKETAFP